MRLTSECPPQRCRVCANPFRDFDLCSLTLLRSFWAEENSKQELRKRFSSNAIMANAAKLAWYRIYVCACVCACACVMNFSSFFRNRKLCLQVNSLAPHSFSPQVPHTWNRRWDQEKARQKASLPLPTPPHLVFHYLFTVCSFSIARILMPRRQGVSACQNHFLTRETRWK